MRQRRSLILPGALALTLAGCGGGGGSNGPPVVPTANFRTNVVGDSWVYDVTANVPELGNGSGTYTQELFSDTYNGSPSVRTTTTFDISYSAGPFVLAASTESSLTGQLLAETSSGGYTDVTQDSVIVGPTLSLSTDVKGTITEADGTIETEEYKVVGTQRVTEPAGTFDCWVVQETSSRQDGTTDSFKLFVAPETGNWVEAIAQTNYGGGQVFTWHARLKSMTTPTGTPGAKASLRSFLPVPRFKPSPLPATH